MSTNTEPGKDFEFHASRPHPLFVAAAVIVLAIIVVAIILN